MMTVGVEGESSLFGSHTKRVYIESEEFCNMGKNHC